MKKKLRKLLMKIILNLFEEKNSTIHCDPSGDFYGIYYSDLKKWVIKDGDYCKLKPNATPKAIKI